MFMVFCKCTVVISLLQKVILFLREKVIFFREITTLQYKLKYRLGKLGFNLITQHSHEQVEAGVCFVAVIYGD